MSQHGLHLIDSIKRWHVLDTMVDSRPSTLLECPADEGMERVARGLPCSYSVAEA